VTQLVRVDVSEPGAGSDTTHDASDVMSAERLSVVV
jgi:hypothetical protein